MISELQSVEIKIGSIFDDPADLIVIPSNVNGGISVNFYEGLKQLKVAPSEPGRKKQGELGELSNVKTISTRKFRHLVYAFIVDNDSLNNKTHVSHIEKIGRLLGELTKSKDIRKIVSPLLGTSNGKVAFDQSYKALRRGFLSTASDSSQLLIITNDSGVLQIVRKADQQVLSGLSHSKIEEQFVNLGLTLKGLVGYIMEEKNDVASVPFQILILSNPTDFFYTIDIKDERLENRKPVAPGILGHVAVDARSNLIQLHRFLHEMSKSHIFVTNPNYEVLKSNNFKEETRHAIFLFKEPLPGTKPVYLYSELHADFFTPLLEIDTITLNQTESEAERRITYYATLKTEGDHGPTQDQLEFAKDIESFANVITLKSIKPPLAIGLFGNWGSGKSFFMEKLSDRIGAISESKEVDYIENVVQVKFNSWHYSDANLWASLITQIFESLHDYAIKKEFGADAINAIYKDLHITSKQLEETQKQLDANIKHEDVLQEQKNNVEEIIRQKKEVLNLWTAKDLVKVVFSDSYIQKDFENIKAQFEEEKLIENINQIEERIAKIDTVGGQVVKSFELLKKNHKGQWAWIWILALLFFGGTWLVLGPLKEYIQNFIRGSIVVTGFALGWFINLNAKLAPYFNKITQFYKRLKSLKQTIESEKEKVKLKEHDEVARLKKEINDLTKEKTELELEQTLTKDKKEKLENELKEIGSGRLLASFLEGKSTDDAYIKQLGVISWVRKDFAKLNEIFEKQKTFQVSEKNIAAEVQIDRIVLYIDDLDRCNEDVVVRVLEAIHLLLAFPLFVVIVGVDPRWLNNALSKKYENLFGSNERQNPKIANGSNQSSDINNSSLEGVATSYDYLEKIFQIPFALKPINKTGRENLIQYLIKDEMVEDKNEVLLSSNKPAITTSDPIGGEPNDQSLNLNDGNERNSQSQVKEERSEAETSRKQRLVFSASELAYMQQISSLFGHTPRMVNRYVNIYRIIKAHGNLKITGDYPKEDFMPTMFMLAVVVGCSTFAEEFINELSKAADSDNFKNFLGKAELNPKLRNLITPHSADLATLLMIKFKRNVELISRFSFRTLLRKS